MLEHEVAMIAYSVVELPWMRDPREVKHETDTLDTDWTVSSTDNGTVRSAAGMDSYSSVEQQCHEEGCRGFTVTVNSGARQLQDAESFMYSVESSSPVHMFGSSARKASEVASVVPVAVTAKPTSTDVHRVQHSADRLRSCLSRGQNEEGISRRVKFSHAVSFWFPGNNQLQFTRDSFAAPHSEASLQGGSCRPLGMSSCHLLPSTCHDSPALQSNGDLTATSFHGGSCRPLVMWPALERPPTPPIPSGRWARSFDHDRTGTVIDVDFPCSDHLEPTAVCVVDTDVTMQYDDTAFAVFDVLHHVRVLRCRGWESYEQLAEIAFEQTPLLQQPRSFRVVQHNLPGLPNRQLVIWGRKPRDAVVFPVALGASSGRICTIQVPVHVTALQAIEIADRHCLVGGAVIASIADRTANLVVNTVTVPPHVPMVCEQADTALVLPDTSFPPITRQHAAAPTHFRPGRWRLPLLLRRSGIDPVDGQRTLETTRTDRQASGSTDTAVLDHELSTTTRAAGHSLFTVFDEHYHARIFVRSDAATIWDLVELAAQSSPETRHGLSYRLLHYVLPGWPEPQLVIWSDLPSDAVVLPVKVPTELGVCTVRASKSSNAFAVSVEVCHKCRLEQAIFQSIARRESTLMVNWQAQLPFADHCLNGADSAVITCDHMAVRPSSSRRGYALRHFLQVLPRTAFTDGEPLQEVVVHAPCRHACRLHIPGYLRPYYVLRAAAAAVGHSRATRLLFLENSPVCHGTPPHAIVTDSQDLPDGHRWMLIDLRRLCMPPYTTYFVLPAPAIVDLPWVRCVLRRNFQRLPHLFAAYLDETLLDRPCALQSSVPLVTVLPLLVGSQDRTAVAAPALLDTCSELLCRAGYRALYFALAGRQHPTGDRCTTTSTTTGMLPRVSPEHDSTFGALHDPLTNVQSRTLDVFVASAQTKYVSYSIRGNVVLEDLLSFATVQLGGVQQTYSADQYAAVPRTFFGPTGRPTLFFTASNIGSPNTVWVDARPFLPQPVMLVVYTPVFVTHICNLLRRPDLRAHCWACNGVVWEHMLLWTKRGDVITVRPHRSALFTAPLSLLRLRIVYVQSLLFGFTGPAAPASDQPTLAPAQFSTDQIRQHWATICAAADPLFGDSADFSKVLLLADGLPPIRCSARTRVAPSEREMQAAYDAHLAPIFGDRTWIDTGEIDGEHSIFIDESSQRHRHRPWLVTYGFCHDAFVSDDQGDGLLHVPVPFGFRLRPVWFCRFFGRAILSPSSAPNSPLHRSEHTDPSEILVVRPDLLQLAARDTLAEPSDEVTDSNIDLLHEELMQIDRDFELRRSSNNPTSDTHQLEEPASSSNTEVLVVDDSDDESVHLMQTAASSHAPAASEVVDLTNAADDTTLYHPQEMPPAPEACTGGTSNAAAANETDPVATDPFRLDFTCKVVTLTRTERVHYFTLFDPQLQTRLVNKRPEWMTADCYHVAMSLCSHLGPDVVVRQLSVEIEGLPTPQFTAAVFHEPVVSRTFPLDCRGLGLGICVITAPCAATPFTLAYRSSEHCGYGAVHSSIARGTATALARHATFHPFEAIPWQVDSAAIRASESPVSIAPASSSAMQDSDWLSGVTSQLQEVRDILEEQFQDRDTYLVMIHTVDLAPMFVVASQLWRADQLADAVSAAIGSTVDIHWPGLVPYGTDALLHVVVEAHHKLDEDQTLFLVDGAALRPTGPRFKTIAASKRLTLGELFCLVRDAFPTAFAAAEIRINGRVLESTGPRTYYCPLVRPVPHTEALHRPGVYVAAGIKPQYIVEQLPGLAIDLQQAQREHLEHVSSSSFSEEISAMSLLQVRSVKHLPANVEKTMCSTFTRLRVWRPSEGM